MSRPSKPWYRESKGTWYCTLDGKKVSLRVRGRENEAEATQAWHRLFATGTPDPTPPPEPGPASRARPEGGVTVGEVVTAFLVDAEGRTKPKTVRAYRYFLLPFVDVHGEKTACSLTPPAAEAYSRKPAWSPQTRHGFLSALMTAFR